MDPFEYPPCSIPDNLTAPTLKMKSLSNLSFTTLDPSANPGTSHGALVLIQPSAKSASITGYMAYNPTINAFQNPSNLETTVPNFNAVFPTSGSASYNVTADDYRYRCTALGVRLTYCGTELNRGGQVVVGIIEPDLSPNGDDVFYECFGNSGTALSANLTRDAVMKRFTRYKVFREWDDVLEFESIPSGCPQYQLVTLNNGANGPPLNTMTQSNRLPCLAIMILGDTTTTSASTGNVFELEVMRHWEVISPSDLVTGAPPTPSVCDARQLEHSLNLFGAAYLDLPTKRVGHDSRDGLATARKGALYGAAAAATAYAGYKLYQEYQRYKAKQPSMHPFFTAL